MDALGINPGYLLMQIFGIIALLMILQAALYKPVLKTLEGRKARIAKGLEDARQAEIARNNAEAEAKRILDVARAEATKIRAEAVSVAEESRKSIEVDAKDSARTILAKAEKDATQRRDQALGDLRGQIASIAIAAANRIVGESLDEKRQHALIANFFSKVPASVSSLSGTSAEVTSALPLTDAEKAEARRAIKASQVDFKVDPSILGGLIVRVGDRIVDNSVASQVGSLRESIK